MKKIFFIVAFFTTITIQNSFAQDSSKTTPLTQLLNSYYGIKNALVSSDAKTAATNAGELLKAINGVDMKALSETDMNAFMPLREKLAFDTKHISENNGIAEQREHFSSLSNNIYKLAKAVKLSADPVYQEYCPMKKMYWLSSEAAIKNPYYGKMMLTCGKVTDTLK
ncbi:MAG: DUF3347 domain-containing protein [Ferruginibacter sp.]